MENKKVIQVKDLTKMYKLYDKPSDRLKEALGLTRKKLYKEHYALHDVNFDIYEGECVGIIGTNGSGKSTILKIITGVLTPTAGEVKVDGRISALLELGAGFNMEYSGLENVYLNGTMIGFSKEEIDARLNDILEFADIGDFIHQPVKTYSSGMFVRLAFAVAINIDPEILVVDEALSVGDVFFQAKCYHKFEEFKKQGKTILFVSHDLGSVSKYCDRVILLNKGVKMDEGSPKQMVDLYKQLLVGQNPVKQNESDSTEQIVAEDSEALIGVPDELGEAALIDGASTWQEYLYVRIPYIKPVIIANCLLVLNGSLRSFEFSYLLTHGGPGNASELMTTYMYKQAFSSMKYGYGSSVAIMIVIICMVVGMLFRKFTGGGDDE